MRAVLNLLLAVVFSAMTVAAVSAVNVAVADSAAAGQACGVNSTCIEVAQNVPGCMKNNEPVAQGQVCCTGVKKFANGAMRCVAPVAQKVCTNPASCCPTNQPQPPGCNCTCTP